METTNHATQGESTHIDIKELIQNDRNSHVVLCKWCQSKILKPGIARYVEEEFFVPFTKKKTDSGNPTDGEKLAQFWMVDDMYNFENVGFSNTVENTKYLICADCEIGPIGVHHISSKKYYVALGRVRHE